MSIDGFWGKYLHITRVHATNIENGHNDCSYDKRQAATYILDKLFEKLGIDVGDVLETCHKLESLKQDYLWK